MCIFFSYPPYHRKVRDIFFPFVEYFWRDGYNIKYFELKDHDELSKIGDFDLCIIRGWKNCVVKSAYNQNCPVICVSDNIIRPKESRFSRTKFDYYGIGWNGPFSGYYYQDDLPDDRWKILQEKYNFKILPWNKKGDHIVIGITNLSYYYKYYDRVINLAIKTGRNIILCTKPGFGISEKYSKKWLKMGCLIKEGIKGNLDNAYCLISVSGTILLYSVFDGIPSYSLGKSLIYDSLIKNVTLEEFLNNPTTPNRNKWLNWIAYQQWTPDEMNQGLPYKYLKSIQNKIKMCRNKNEASILL